MIIGLLVSARSYLGRKLLRRDASSVVFHLASAWAEKAFGHRVAFQNDLDRNSLRRDVSFVVFHLQCAWAEKALGHRVGFKSELGNFQHRDVFV